MRRSLIAGPALLLVSASLFALERPLDDGAYSSTPQADRVRIIAPVAEGELRCRPTFCSCGVCFGAAKPVEGLKLEYRAKGGEWLTEERFPYFEETHDYRGSIMRLAENEEYEVRVGDKTATFRTWTSEPKIAKTVTLNPNANNFPYKITAKGRPDAWVLYTCKPGTVFENRNETIDFDFSGAEYVIFEGFTIRGGTSRHAIVLTNSKAVRIRNCDISHWGRPSALRFDSLGRPCKIDQMDAEVRVFAKDAPGAKRSMKSWRTDSKGTVNFDGAINIGKGCSEIVVERCWIHDCTVHANSWFYSHPAGGEAIVMNRPDHSTVVRWNDFTGSDEHRWNDAVESGGNFAEDGGFNRDADIYGNFMIFCNDDCIELDGGQQNVRCFDNRFESALCGVSIQGCMASPVYVVRNGFYSMCEEFGGAGQTIKTGGGQHGDEAYAFISDNIFWGRGCGIIWMELLRAQQRRNFFCGGQKISGLDRSPKSVSTDDQFGMEVEEVQLPVRCPVRDPGFVMSRSRISGAQLEKGVVSPATLTVSARSTSRKPVPFKVCINDDMPWLKVAPADGKIMPGAETKFTISFDPSLMKTRRWYRGCFLVRTPEGLSRGVSVYVDTDYENPFKCEQEGETAVYADFGPEKQLSPGDVCSYSFTAPKDGRYYFLARLARAQHNKVSFDVTLGSESGSCALGNVWSTPTWLMLGPNLGFGNTIAFRDLTAGEKISISFTYTGSAHSGATCAGVVMTDSPGSFEPR